WIEHVAVIDVAQHHGAPAGCNAAGESLADRDPNALLDLFLDPDRGPRDELVFPGVEEEDSARICLEERAGALEQRLQQLLGLQMAERRVRQLLQTSQLRWV